MFISFLLHLLLLVLFTELLAVMHLVIKADAVNTVTWWTRDITKSEYGNARYWPGCSRPCCIQGGTTFLRRTRHMTHILQKKKGLFNWERGGGR